MASRTLARVNSKTKSADLILDGTNNKVFTAAEKAKLAGLTNGGGSIGVDPITKSFTGKIGNNQTYILDIAPSSVSAIFVYVGGVRQVPTIDYTVNGTTLTVLSNSDGLEVDTVIFNGIDVATTSASISNVPKSFTGKVGNNQTYVLDVAPVNANNIFVFIGGVRQVPVNDYTVSGTTLTVLTNPGGDDVDTLVVGGPFPITTLQGKVATDFAPVVQGTGFPVALWNSGTTRTMIERGKDTYCILDAPGQADPTGNNVSTQALKAMLTEANNGSGIKLDLMAGNYKTEEGLYLNAPAEIVGRGRGYWHANPPTSGDGTPSVAATQIALVGTGPKTRTVHGISEMRPSGGVVINPSASNGNDAEYALSSFMNPVSDGSLPRSPKAISAGLWLGPDAVGSIIRGFRILPHGGGLKSLDKYTIAGNANDPWADNWDYGLVIEMANRVVIADFEAVGHFRGAGELLLAIHADPNEEFVAGREALWGAMHLRSGFSGYRGIEVRGSDAFTVVTVTATYIEVPWADDHPFNVTLYPRFSYGSGTFTSAGTKVFTATSKVGNNLRIAIADTSGISVGNQIFARRYLGGTSHCTWDLNCSANGMQHQSGLPAHAAALGANAMPHPSAAFVASGWRMTELEFYGKIQSKEEVGIHVHSLSGSTIIPQIEGGGVKPLRIIKSPSSESDNTRVTNPAGRTQFCYIDSTRGLKNETGIDVRPLLANSVAATAYPSDNGLFGMSPDDNCEVPSMDFRKVDGIRSLDYDRVNSRNRIAAHLEPLVDNTYDLGTSGRFRGVRSRQFFFGSGTARITGGTGTPNGVQGGNAGSEWTDEATGKKYIKDTNTGNTDWREVPRIIRGSVAWNPPSIPTGGSAAIDVTMTGVTSDTTFSVGFSLYLQGMGISANYRAADTVTVVITNNTGAAIDIGAGTVYVTGTKV